MKLYKDIIIQGIHLVRHLKTGNELDLAKLASLSTRTAARSLLVGGQRRAAYDEESEEGDDFFTALVGGQAESDDDAAFDFLSAFGGGDDFLGLNGGEGNNESGWFDLSSMMGAGEEDSGNDFSDLLSSLMLIGLRGAGEDDDKGFGILGDVMQNVEACGIDLGDMASKLLVALMTTGTEMDTIDYSDPQSYDMFAQMLMAFRDDDESVCSEAESARLPVASEKFLQCAGMSDFFSEDETETTMLSQTILESCKPIAEAGSGGLTSLQDLSDESSDLYRLGRECFQTVYGDNSLGNSIRYEYQHMDKVFDCFGKLGEDLPHCVLSSSSPHDDGTTHSVPLSLLKKLACVVGSSFKPALDMLCLSYYETLDECLPQLDEDILGNGMMPMCANLGDIGFGMDSSVMTGNTMPAFCTKIFDEKGIDTIGVQTRLDRYNENREYGWTLESIGNSEAHAAVQEMKEARISFSLEERPSQESFKSWLGEVSMGTIILVVFGIAALALVITATRIRLTSGSTRSAARNATSSRQNYEHLATEMGGNEIL